MKSTDITKIAIAFTSGMLTEDYIRTHYGDDIFAQVLALGGGIAAGTAFGGLANSVIDGVERHTGLFSIADEVVDVVNPLNWFD